MHTLGRSEQFCSLKSGREAQEATLRSLMRSPFSSKAIDPESSACQQQLAGFGVAPHCLPLSVCRSITLQHSWQVCSFKPTQHTHLQR
jgi:hypothetical protein